MYKYFLFVYENYIIHMKQLCKIYFKYKYIYFIYEKIILKYFIQEIIILHV